MQMGMNRFAKAELTGGWKRNEWRVLASADYSHSKGYYAPDPTDKEATALKNSDFNGAIIYLVASWTLSYRDRVGQFNHADGTVSDFRPVLLLDGKLYYDIPHWRFAVSCTNMTNRHYYDYGGVLQPGAWAKVSIEYHLYFCAI